MHTLISLVLSCCFFALTLTLMKVSFETLFLSQLLKKVFSSVNATATSSSNIHRNSSALDKLSTDHLMTPPLTSSTQAQLTFRLYNIPSTVKLLYQLFIHFLLLASVTLLMTEYFHTSSSSSNGQSFNVNAYERPIDCRVSFAQLTRRQKNILVDEFLQGKINGTNYTSCNLCDLTRQLRNFTLECAEMRYKLNQSLVHCGDELSRLREYFGANDFITFASSSGHRISARLTDTNEDEDKSLRKGMNEAISQRDFEKKLQEKLVHDYEKNFHRNIQSLTDTNGTQADADDDD